jgi:hypothetical protein
MSDVSSDLGGIRAGPLELDIEQVHVANPSLGGSIFPPPSLVPLRVQLS